MHTRTNTGNRTKILFPPSHIFCAYAHTHTHTHTHMGNRTKILFPHPHFCVNTHTHTFTHTLTQGIVLGAFFNGYIFTQILGGMLSRRFGGKFVLIFCVAFASFFTVGFFFPFFSKCTHSCFNLLLCSSRGVDVLWTTQVSLTGFFYRLLRGFFFSFFKVLPHMFQSLALFLSRCWCTLNYSGFSDRFLL